MDLSMLNHAVMSTWGDDVSVNVAGVSRIRRAVFIEAYQKSPVGNTDVERPDPSFSFESSDFGSTAATVGDLIDYLGVSYTIASDPTYEPGDWCNVMVRVYS